MTEISLISSEEEARAMFEKKKKLNPEIVKRHIRSFNEWMRDYDRSESFTEREVIYYYDDNFLMHRNIRPEPYFPYILMNKKFVIDIDTNRRDFMILDFRGNINKPNDADIEAIKTQIFKFFAMKNSFGWPMVLMEKEQTTFEIIGVEK